MVKHLPHVPANHVDVPFELVLIAAVARNGAIGKDNRLLVSIRDDLQRFKELTTGHPVIMGRKTFESIGRPLPNRRNLVITRSPNWTHRGAERCLGLLDAFSRVMDAQRVFVIGGEQIYNQALPLAHRLEITQVHADLPGDAFFPADRSGFAEVDRVKNCTADLLRYDFVTWLRTSRAASAKLNETHGAQTNRAAQAESAIA